MPEFHLEIPTIVSSNDPRDTLRAVRDTLDFAADALNHIDITVDDYTENHERLTRLLDDANRQLDAETPQERSVRQVVVSDIKDADSTRQLAAFIIDGWLPPKELADEIIRTLARRVLV